eukprot:scaffold9749_cov33-Phaeocystis_antarctica.AAC.3
MRRIVEAVASAALEAAGSSGARRLQPPRHMNDSSGARSPRARGEGQRQGLEGRHSTACGASKARARRSSPPTAPA